MFIKNILLCGDSGVGKSCLLSVLTGGPFNLEQIPTFGVEYKPTFGVEYKRRDIEKDGYQVRYQFYDVSGAEGTADAVVEQFRHKQVAVFVYDISNRESFENIESYLNKFKEKTVGNPPLFLVGNKCELEGSRVVTNEEAQEFARKNKMFFIETSAQNNVGVDQFFEQIRTNNYEILDPNKSFLKKAAETLIAAVDKGVEQGLINDTVQQGLTFYANRLAEEPRDSNAFEELGYFLREVPGQRQLGKMILGAGLMMLGAALLIGSLFLLGASGVPASVKVPFFIFSLFAGVPSMFGGAAVVSSGQKKGVAASMDKFLSDVKKANRGVELREEIPVKFIASDYFVPYRVGFM